MHKNSPQILCILPIDTKSQLRIVYKSEGKSLCILPYRQNLTCCSARPPLCKSHKSLCAHCTIEEISAGCTKIARKFVQIMQVPNNELARRKLQTVYYLPCHNHNALYNHHKLLQNWRVSHHHNLLLCFR